MRIVRVELCRLPLTLREPYEIAYDRVTSVENVFLQLVTDTEHVGLGCAAPDVSVTGETPAHSLAALERLDLRGAEPARRARHLLAGAELMPDCPAALAALDMALLDALGKQAGLPVHRLLGGFRDSIATSVTVFIAPLDEMVRRAVDYVAQGFSALKLKGGKDVAADIAAVQATREAIGPDVELRFDANQGYTLRQALAFAKATQGQVRLFEQPTRRGRPAALAEVTAAVGALVVADESVIGPHEMLRLVKGQAADVVNLKLMKAGGIDACTTIDAVAWAAKVQSMVGCVDESALAIAAGLHMALGRPNVAFADLDGHLDLLDDPAAGAVRLERGVLHPLDGPGLGLHRLSVFE